LVTNQGNANAAANIGRGNAYAGALNSAGNTALAAGYSGYYNYRTPQTQQPPPPGFGGYVYNGPAYVPGNVGGGYQMSQPPPPPY
jgi:hypothetical protein